MAHAFLLLTLVVASSSLVGQRYRDHRSLVVALLAVAALVVTAVLHARVTPLVLLAAYLTVGAVLAHRWFQVGSRDGFAIWRFMMVTIVGTAWLALCMLWHSPLTSVAATSAALGHLFLVVSTAATATAACGLGCALAVQDYCLRYKRPLPLTLVFPSLIAADTALYRLAGMTFALLTGAILSALLSAHVQWSSWSWEPRTIGAPVLWLVYGVGLHMRRIAGWRGLRLSAIVLTGYVSFVILAGLVLTGVGR